MIQFTKWKIYVRHEENEISFWYRTYVTLGRDELKVTGDIMLQGLRNITFT